MTSAATGAILNTDPVCRIRIDTTGSDLTGWRVHDLLCGVVHSAPIRTFLTLGPGVKWQTCADGEDFSDMLIYVAEADTLDDEHYHFGNRIAEMVKLRLDAQDEAGNYRVRIVGIDAQMPGPGRDWRS